MANFQAVPYGQACHVTPRIYYSTIQIPSHLTAAELLAHYSQPGTLPSEFIALPLPRTPSPGSLRTQPHSGRPLDG
jgi:hypothetical protein